MDVSNISALGYLAAENNAVRDGEGIAALRRLRNQLNSLPHVRVRLAFEFLAMAATAVRRGEDADRLAFLGLVFTAQQSAKAVPGIVESIESLTLLTFEAIGTAPNEGFGHTLASLDFHGNGMD
jgi:hypothetical protein